MIKVGLKKVTDLIPSPSQNFCAPAMFIKPKSFDAVFLILPKKTSKFHSSHQ